MRKRADEKIALGKAMAQTLLEREEAILNG
jgi:hypothetical protein